MDMPRSTEEVASLKEGFVLLPGKFSASLQSNSVLGGASEEGRFEDAAVGEGAEVEEDLQRSAALMSASLSFSA